MTAPAEPEQPADLPPLAPDDPGRRFADWDDDDAIEILEPGQQPDPSKKVEEAE